MALADALSLVVNGEVLDLDVLGDPSIHKLRLEDTSFEVEVSIFSMPDNLAASSWQIYWGAYPIANATLAPISLDPVLLARIEARVRALPPGITDFWPRDHQHEFVDRLTRFKDDTDDTRLLIDVLRTGLNVLDPPADHSRVGGKPDDRFDIAKLHIDRFRGMRYGEERIRRRISRHFVNLGSARRHVFFALMDPTLVDQHVGDEYHNTYIDALFEVMGRKVSMLWAPIPPLRPDLVFGARYLSSHLLHCEYAYGGDFIAVINSDSERRQEERRASAGSGT